MGGKRFPSPPPPPPPPPQWAPLQPRGMGVCTYNDFFEGSPLLPRLLLSSFPHMIAIFLYRHQSLRHHCHKVFPGDWLVFLGERASCIAVVSLWGKGETEREGREGRQREGREGLMGATQTHTQNHAVQGSSLSYLSLSVRAAASVITPVEGRSQATVPQSTQFATSSSPSTTTRQRERERERA